MAKTSMTAKPELTVATANAGHNATSLGKAAGISSATAWRMYNGVAISAQAAKKVADALGRAVKDLFQIAKEG